MRLKIILGQPWEPPRVVNATTGEVVEDAVAVYIESLPDYRRVVWVELRDAEIEVVAPEESR